MTTKICLRTTSRLQSLFDSFSPAFRLHPFTTTSAFSLQMKSGGIPLLFRTLFPVRLFVHQQMNRSVNVIKIFYRQAWRNDGYLWIYLFLKREKYWKTVVKTACLNHLTTSYIFLYFLKLLLCTISTICRIVHNSNVASESMILFFST